MVKFGILPGLGVNQSEDFQVDLRAATPIVCQWSHVLKDPLKTKLGSLSGLCMEKYTGHEKFQSQET